MTRSHFNRKNIIFLTFIIFCFLCAHSAFADLSINLIAVNASGDEVKEIDVKYYLPVELKPKDILDSGPLRVEYDIEKGAYFVRGMVKFQPKESKTFKIKVRDVWVLDLNEIENLKKQLVESLALLEEDDFEYYDSARAVADKLSNQLDAMVEEEKSLTENIERRIEAHRFRLNTLQQFRADIYNPNFLRNEAFVEIKRSEEKTIKLVIEVRNPSTKNKKTVRHKHYLPKEVRPHDIIENRGFDIRFDAKTERAFLTKEETFKPAEVKRYDISIRDIWFISLAKVDALENRGEYAMKEIQKSAYFDSGDFLFKEIGMILQQVRDSQAEEVSIKKHIGIFRVNGKRYKEAEAKVQRIEEMMAIVKAKKLKEYERKVVKNVLKKLKSLRGIAQISEALFKKGVSVTTTWRVIIGVLAFVVAFSVGHFMRWSVWTPKQGELTEKGEEGEEEKKE